MLAADFTGRYCHDCRPRRGNAFTKNTLRAHGVIEYIADQRAQGVPWRDIALALHYPGHPAHFAAYVSNTSEWQDFIYACTPK